VIPYAVDSLVDAAAEKGEVVIERAAGLDFYLDPSLIDAKKAARIRGILADAMAALDKRKQDGA
jgi:hypothetical protein